MGSKEIDKLYGQISLLLILDKLKICSDYCHDMCWHLNAEISIIRDAEQELLERYLV